MSGPLSSIRKYCRWCTLENSSEIRKCPSSRCDFHPVRMGRGVPGVSSLKRIRAQCIECSGSIIAVRDCWAADCSLYAYRFGHNPARKGIGASAEHMRSIRGLVGGAFPWLAFSALLLLLSWGGLS